MVVRSAKWQKEKEGPWEKFFRNSFYFVRFLFVIFKSMSVSMGIEYGRKEILKILCFWDSNFCFVKKLEKF